MSERNEVHCEQCGCTWLDDGLNPTGCPYCENAKLREVLRQVEWSSLLLDPAGSYYPACPCCGGFDPRQTGIVSDGHVRGCILAQTICTPPQKKSHE